MYQLEVFPDERDIAEDIQKSSVISSIAKLEVTDSFELPKNLLNPPMNKLLSSMTESVDLYYMKSLLVSSVWNGNDELFLASEIWNARNTCGDKPFNYEHIEDDIIGHTINGIIVDDNGNIINSEEELSPLIHIISNAVLYKHWDNKDNQDRMNTLLDEIKEDKWGVSVECLFPKFDYALKDSDGNIEIIERNKDTSFLTKYLRRFKGSGKYDNKLIARVPRNFIISGKGLTRTPANKASRILCSKLFELNNVKLNSEKESVYVSSDNKEVKKMDNDKELQYQKTINDLKVAFDELKASVATNEIEKVKAELKLVSDKSEAYLQEISVLKASLEKVNNEKSELIKTSEEILAAKNTLEADYAKLIEDNKLQSRINTVKSELNMSDEDAKVFVNSVNKLSDEAFSNIINLQKKFVSTNTTKVVEEVKIDETKVEKAVANINDPNIVIKVDSDKEKFEKLQASIAEYLYKQREVINKVREKSRF